MSFERVQFELLGKAVFGRATFIPPFKAGESLLDEARFVSIIRGNSKLFVPNNQLELSSSDSMLMKCENFVNHWLPNEGDSTSQAIIVQFYPEVLAFAYDNKLPEIFNEKRNLNPDPAAKIKTNQIIEHFNKSLQFYFDNPSYVTDELLKIKIKELIELLIISDTNGKIKAILGTLFQTNEYEFKEIIHSHLYEDLSIQDLALFAGLSLSSFKRKFNTVFGTSPNRYIKGKRLEKAQSLLQTSNLRISEIAYDCGFNDVAYFSKTFQTAYNCSPSEYRKKFVS
ncbi:MAG: AraC family transcriptional regulator [Flavobacteriales bacterium]|nr:AraC family transcriptional regulator [Flavobacteriales bacterium]